ncbi:DUF2851 family protein [Mangrovimonas cancribranchiae]|uniref:DUF2851 family protein n=1 Tax=Mangrovimonas cancribranchiae TaxID=3080055 RepID=A0AAU6P428_9FLAO
MQEAFLHYIWKHKKFDVLQAQTTQYESLTITSVGQHNHNSGPDFFNAQIRISEQLWAGNVEIHINSSDWFVHHHEQDKAYDNVILHVVYNHDTDIFRKDNSVLPTLELKNYISKDILSNYNNLLSTSEKWINCENEIALIEDFIIDNWLERLYFERLEDKTNVIQQLLETSNNDWEAVLFKLLAKNFGLKVNGEAFFSMSKSFDFSVVRKLSSKPDELEALFFGQSGLFNKVSEVPYFLELSSKYNFIKQKFGLSNESVLPLKFFRLRPKNFPTIRLSQLAMLYSIHQGLFFKLIEAKDKKSIYEIFKTGTLPFWETHYTFQKESKATQKNLSKSFIDLLIINTIIPLKFTYNQSVGKNNNEAILKLVSQIKPEKNQVITAFSKLRPMANSALQTQALLQLKNKYCNYNKCLQCAIGNTLIAK